MPKPIPPAKKLNANILEVRQLLSIHRLIAGDSPGRKHNVEILNKSAVVLLVACWEAFVEDTCEAALDFIIENAKDHAVFPKDVLERVASKHTGIKAWDFADEGWKTCLRNNVTEVLARTTGKLNTPKTAQVNELFLKTLGLDGMSSRWFWKARSAKSSADALDALVTLRGSIAHRVDAEKSVRLIHVKAGIGLTFRLAAKTSNAVRTHVHSLVGEYPWALRRFKTTW